MIVSVVFNIVNHSTIIFTAHNKDCQNVMFIVNHTKIIFNEKKKNRVQYIGKFNLLFMDIIIW